MSDCGNTFVRDRLPDYVHGTLSPGDAAGVGDQHAGGAGVEGEIPLDPLAALVLAPYRDHDQQRRRSRREQREHPEGHGTGDGRLAEEFLALGVDRLLSE